MKFNLIKIYLLLVIAIGISSCCQHSGYLYKFTLYPDKEYYKAGDTVKIKGIIENNGDKTFSFINSTYNLYDHASVDWLLQIYDQQQRYYNSYNLGDILYTGVPWYQYTYIYPKDTIELSFFCYLPGIIWRSEPEGKYKIDILYHDIFLKSCSSIDSMQSNVIDVEFVK